MQIRAWRHNPWERPRLRAIGSPRRPLSIQRYLDPREGRAHPCELRVLSIPMRKRSLCWLVYCMSMTRGGSHGAARSRHRRRTVGTHRTEIEDSLEAWPKQLSGYWAVLIFRLAGPGP